MYCHIIERFLQDPKARAKPHIVVYAISKFPGERERLLTLVYANLSAGEGTISVSIPVTGRPTFDCRS